MSKFSTSTTIFSICHKLYFSQRIRSAWVTSSLRTTTLFRADITYFIDRFFIVLQRILLTQAWAVSSSALGSIKRIQTSTLTINFHGSIWTIAFEVLLSPKRIITNNTSSVITCTWFTTFITYRIYLVIISKVIFRFADTLSLSQNIYHSIWI